METDFDELMRDNVVVAADAIRRAQGEPMILVVYGDRYAEVLEKDAETVLLSFPNRHVRWPVADVETMGFRAVRGLRLIKDNGTLTYIVPVEGGVDLYSAGKCYPATRRKK